MKKNRLIYMPLGGAGEIGMNAYVYGFGAVGAERLILVDLGIGFPDMETNPGVDLVLPDLSWLQERAERLEAIFITHGHEDHIGAVVHFASMFRVPIYCRAFAANIVEQKCNHLGIAGLCIRRVKDLKDIISAGPFDVHFIPVSHSIPQSSALVIDCSAGRVFHSGDFKIDKTPTIGDCFDDALFKEAAQPGIKALICDSTNIFSYHEGRSESSVYPALEQHIAKAKGMVVATTFASNVGRLKNLAMAGKKSGRAICLLGRAVERMIDIAKQTGLADGFPVTISAQEAMQRPRDSVMLIVTGAQGEMRAASSRLSQGKYSGFRLKEGDCFIFSSKTIPGNERAIFRIVNNLSALGVDVLDEKDDHIHVSGHPNRPEILHLYSLLKPDMVVPIHGEHRHLRAHAKFARENALASIVATNGMMVDLTNDKPKIVEHIEYVKNYLDGKRIIGSMDGVIRDRLRLAREGLLVVNLMIDEEDAANDDVLVQTMGLCADDMTIVEAVETEIKNLLQRIDRDNLVCNNKLEKTFKKTCQNTVCDLIGKNPQIVVSFAYS